MPTNTTKIGNYTVREDGEAIHVESPLGRVVSIVGDGNYRAFHNEVYAALRVGTDAAVDALGGFLSRRGVQFA